MNNILILGANSHISKGLIYNFYKNKKYTLYLFTTNIERLKNFLTENKIENVNIRTNIDDLKNINMISLINCIGVGTENKLKGRYYKYFTIPEEYDNFCLDYIRKNKKCVYINFSSGAIYKKLNPSNIKSEDFYSITRYYLEAKHRSFKDLNIVDLRLFSYFSRFIDFNDKYFITEIIDCVLNNKKFITTKENIVRDYLHPEDLFNIILKCIDKKRINDFFDINSKKDISKKEILDYFINIYNLEVEYKKDINYKSATGNKVIYKSNNTKLKEILNYSPKYSSLECIKNEFLEIN